MPSNLISQIALATFATLLASAMPLEARDNTHIEPIVQCGDLWKKNGWTNDQPVWMSNPASGTGFCSTQWDTGNRVLGIAAWKVGPACDGKSALSRVEIRYSNGHVDAIGGTDKTCEAGSIGIAADELFTYVGTNVAGDSPPSGPSQGKIHFKTSQGGQQKQERWLKDEYNPGARTAEQATDGGVMIGVTGVVDRNIIKQLNFHFTKAAVTKITRDNMQYDLNDLNKIRIDNFHIDSVTFANLQRVTNGTYKYENHKGFSQTLSTSTSTSMTIGVKLSVQEKVGIPDIVDVTANQEFSWDTTTTVTRDTSTTQSTDVTWSYQNTVLPGMAADCTVTGGKASGDIPFTSTVTMYFDDGSKYKYNERGVLSADQIVAQHAQVTCSDRVAVQGDWKNQVNPGTA